MKTLFNIFLFSTILLCVSCSKQQVVKSQSAIIPTVKIPVADESTSPSKLEVVPVSVTHLREFKGEGWQFLAPVSWNNVKTVESGIDLLLVKSKDKEVALVAKDTCNTDEQNCITSTVQNLRDGGARIDLVGETVVNSNHFWIIKSIMDNDTMISAWISISNKDVFIFSCGGPIDSNAINDCNEIVETLNLF